MFGEFDLQQFGLAGQCGEWVVELMGDAGGEHAKRVQFFATVQHIANQGQLGLGGLDRRDVDIEPADIDLSAIADVDGKTHHQRPLIILGSRQVLFDGARATGFTYFGIGEVDHLDEVRRHQLTGGEADHLAGRLAEDLLHLGIDGDIAPLVVLDVHAHRGIAHEGGETGLASREGLTVLDLLGDVEADGPIAGDVAILVEECAMGPFQPKCFAVREFLGTRAVDHGSLWCQFRQRGLELLPDIWCQLRLAVDFQ